jgi:hypothetical protein
MKLSRTRKMRHRGHKRSRSRTRNYKHKTTRRRRQPLRGQRHHFRQSGGDLLNYLPSDLGMAARSAAHSIGGVWSGVKGVMGSDNPLPYNDHHLQKASISISDRIPNLKQYYENANSLIPAI